LRVVVACLALACGVAACGDDDAPTPAGEAVPAITFQVTGDPE
jgi:hypothetical protein